MNVNTYNAILVSCGLTVIGLTVWLTKSANPLWAILLLGLLGASSWKDEEGEK